MAFNWRSSEGAAWRALPALVQRDVRVLARQGSVHPDPVIAAAAFAWAGPARRVERRWRRTLIPAVAVVFILLTVDSLAHSTVLVIVAGGILAVTVLGSLVAGESAAGAAAVEAAHCRAMALRPRSASGDAEQDRVVVRARVSRADVDLVGMAAVILVLPGLGRQRWWAAVIAVAMLVLAASGMVHRRRVALVILRRDGIEFPAYRLGPLPWSVVGRADLFVRGSVVAAGWPVVDSGREMTGRVATRGQRRLARFARSGRPILVLLDDARMAPEALLRASWAMAGADQDPSP